jgi:MoxR-like ATPase
MNSESPTPVHATWQRFSLNEAHCTRFSIEEGADQAPPWRPFMHAGEFKVHFKQQADERWHTLQSITSVRALQKAESFFLPDSDACQQLVLAVNAALALRRPLLISGLPGSGKTSLAFVIANWLGLGPVLEWPVSPGAQLADALATYNPLARLQDLEQDGAARSAGVGNENLSTRPVADYIRLGPVGTAFLPASLPRVLLIDEIDKGDFNLANDLLHLFEEGKFSIPELQRAEREQRERAARSDSGQAEGSDQPSPMPEVAIWDENLDGTPLKAPIRGGQVQCHEFPLVLMSSNGEREFPPAFNRRCLRVRMPDFTKDKAALQEIVNRQLQKDLLIERDVEKALADFQAAAAHQGDELAIDQLLNLVYLMDHQLGSDSREKLKKVLLLSLYSEPLSEEEVKNPFGDGDLGGDDLSDDDADLDSDSSNASAEDA